MSFWEETAQLLGMRVDGGVVCRVCVYPAAGAVVEGGQGLYYYSPQCVKVRVKGGKAVIEGGDLTVSESAPGQLVLRGRVECVRWE